MKLNIKITLLIIFNIIAVLMNIYFGSVHINARDITSILCGNEIDNHALSFIVTQSRIPAAVTSLLAGAALGVCGLLLQSYFRNPLAGPSVLGITSGANLAIAISVLGIGPISGIAQTGIAMIGSLAIMTLLIFFGRFVRQSVTLLIVGLLISYFTNAIITLLNYYASENSIMALLIWGMGDFHQVGTQDLTLYSTTIITGLAMSILLIKPLNGWMLGELYAINLGINIKYTRILTLTITGLLASVTTAYCGPISFIGLCIPHIARIITKTDNHRVLIPFSALSGGLCTSICLFLSSLPAEGRLLPINALTPIFGVPVIIYVLLRKK